MLKLSIVVVVIAASVYLLSQYMKPGMCESKDRIDGKVAIVTGGNNGIGRETVRDLVARGGKVYIASRSIERGIEAANDIKNTTGVDDSKVVVLQLNLASFASIRKFSEEFHKREKQLHILVCNAAVAFVPRELTEDGYESQFGVNHLGHFLLTHLLADALVNAAPSRVVMVAANGQKYGTMDFDDLNSEKSYGSITAAIRSKLGNVLFANELARRAKGKITTYSLHPGLIVTDLVRNFIPSFLNTDFVYETIKLVLTPFTRSTMEGAQTTVCCAVHSKFAQDTGKYYEDNEVADMGAAGQDVEAARRLWDASVKMVKLKDSEIHPLLKQRAA